MSQKPSLFLFVVATSAALLVDCATGPKTRLEHQLGESVVFIGEESAALAHRPMRSQPLSIRNTYLPGQGTVEYVEGRDYAVDYAEGTLRRTPGSRLPDFHTNVLFGQQEFDHSKFPGFGNGGYFAFVDYSFAQFAPWPSQAPQTQFLKTTQAKLKAGEAAKIIAFGHSIAAGGDASKPELVFWRRWAEELQRKYPRARITAINAATGGDTTVQGLQRLQVKVLDEKPDLVLTGFGMNDHNVGSVPIPQFKENLKEMISRIRSETGRRSCCSPRFHLIPSGNSDHITWRITRGQPTPWRKKPPVPMLTFSIIGNHSWFGRNRRIYSETTSNHPNDFGHWIYFRVFEELGL